MLFPSHCSADLSSELFHEHTTFLQDTTFPQPSSIGRASNLTYTRLRIARTLNWAEGEGLWHFPSHCSADSSSELFHEHTTFPQETTFPQPSLNWPSIQLNIHTTENCANTELG